LNRKFDRFKFQNFNENLPEIKKIFYVNNIDCGLQFANKKYLIWKHQHKSKLKVIREFYPGINIIKIEISVKRKKRRRKMSLIVSLMKIPLFEKVCKVNKNVFYQFFKKDRLNGLLL
jgi:hypothetical protein